MQIIQLNRRFVEWDDKEIPNSDLRRAMGLGEVGIGWEELLLRRRVIVLAEAGSGKSAEIAQRMEKKASKGQHSFHATVEDVGRDGLESAIMLGAERVKTWRESADEAWFFIDSVDEAKASGIRFERVARKIAEGIHGAEERAHIILSGRVTDWEHRKDLSTVQRLLPISSSTYTPAATPEEELLGIIRRQQRPKETPVAPDVPFVARMAPLDRDRVRLFAKGKAIPKLDQFLEAVDGANLWRFAERPLDLDWLVKFWQTEGRLGSLAEMVERSVTERLKETNSDLARGDLLENDAARHAAERLGAAMVFGRRSTIAIPDSELAFSSDTLLDLAEILPDWSEQNRKRLLSRPIFDPATLGRARFHSDNEGFVRGFLTASWLKRLRSANLSTGALFDLLFAKSYGLDVIKPSMNETVAWLSLWDNDVANEVIRRGPGLLLDAGDPASLSSNIRRSALRTLVEGLSTGEHESPFWNNDRLRRFAHPDLIPEIISLWSEYGDKKEIAELLLSIVWLGGLQACSSLARDATFDPSLDRTPRLFASRALLAVGSEADRKDYAELVMAQPTTLPSEMTREAIVELFPTLLGVPDLLKILKASDVSTDRTGLGFQWEGPPLVRKLSNPLDLENLLSGLLALLGSELGDHAHYQPTIAEQVYFPAMAESAFRLLKASSSTAAPDAAIDAILRICNRKDVGSDVTSAKKLALAELHGNASRRRLSFWSVAQNLRGTAPHAHRLDQLWQMQLLGYAPGLQVEDVDWLLTDGLTRCEADRRLAVDSAMAIYRFAGAPTEMLERIASAVAGDAVAAEAYEQLVAARPAPPEQTQSERDWESLIRENEAARQSNEQSWIDYFHKLRANSQQIARMKVPPASGTSDDLYRVWRLLNDASGQARYAIESVAPLERMLGSEVAEAARVGLMAYWRNSAPRLRSQAGARNVDLMGLVGVSLEAASSDGWANGLSSHEATLAASYATLELNGFPNWLTVLAIAKPEEVSQVLLGEIVHEVNQPNLDLRDTLNTVSYSEDEVPALIAPRLLAELEKRPLMPIGALSKVLRILMKGLDGETAAIFVHLALERFENDTDVVVAVDYLAAAFALNPRMVTESLIAKLGRLEPDEQCATVDRFFLTAFGDSSLNYTLRKVEIDADTLEKLVGLSFQSRNEAAGRHRAAGVIYESDTDDQANQARSSVFNKLAQTPGAATYATLLRLREIPGFPVSSARLRAIADERAVQDSESAPWPPSEAYEFELHQETAPRTAKDLQSVILRRLEDVQHDLIHGDFAQGPTVKALPNEAEVQRWIAERLRQGQGRAFSVEREPHVAGEKEPDIRARSKSTDASVAIEIKVVKSWTLKQLDKALEAQLCGRYLRAENGRHGILLLVHQRAGTWRDTTTGHPLTFQELVAGLSSRAAIIAGQGYDSPQPEVAWLDVSDCS